MSVTYSDVSSTVYGVCYAGVSDFFDAHSTGLGKGWQACKCRLENHCTLYFQLKHSIQRNYDII